MSCCFMCVHCVCILYLLFYVYMYLSLHAVSVILSLEMPPYRPCKKKTTGERFALKCLLDRPRARQELRLQVRCSGHPNIVSIMDIYANEVQFPNEPEPRSVVVSGGQWWSVVVSGGQWWSEPGIDHKTDASAIAPSSSAQNNCIVSFV